MSELTDWVNTELIPAIYERLDTVFPEHSFKQTSQGWESKTYLNGSPHRDRKDKTKVKKGAPYYIFEEGGDGLPLVNYVMKRDGIEWIEAVKKLAQEVNLELPPNPNYDPDNIKKCSDRAKILEEANLYFIFELKTQEGEKTRTYLQGRGYTEEDIKAMGLGFIPGQEKLFKHLTDKGYSQSLIDEVVRIKTDTRIGSTHSLTIPYRSGGTLKGFKFRIPDKDAKGDKYLNTYGLDKSGGFFNLTALKGDKDLVVVEGELDSLHATVKGIENVVAITGSGLNPELLQDAKKRGAKAITLCYDMEPDKALQTEKRIRRDIEIILQAGLRAYVITLPDLGGGKTDPDRLIKEKGAEVFKKAIRGALPSYTYQYRTLKEKYSEKQGEDEVLTFKDLDSFKEELTALAYSIKNPLDRSLFITNNIEADLRNFGINGEAIEQTLEKIRYKQDREARDKELKKLLITAKDLQDKGQGDEALKLIEEGLTKVRRQRGKDLIKPYTFADWELEIASAPPSLKTGYISLDKILRIPQGAITLIAGRPAHGKTSFMFNLLLRMSKEYQDKKFYFFSYEEPRKYILTKILNSLIGANSLRDYFQGVNPDLFSNLDLLRAYLREGRRDIEIIEAGKTKLRSLLDNGNIEIIDRSYTVEELRSLIEYLHKKENIGAIFIDYIQRMSTERRTQDKRTEIAHISDQTLQIAKDTGLPILLGCQLNRATTPGKPSLENLKEAGNLEEDANTVISVYNESREKDQPEDGGYWGNEVYLELKTLKNRDGEPNRDIRLRFNRPSLRIMD